MINSQRMSGWERNDILPDGNLSKHSKAIKVSGKIKANHFSILITFLCTG